MPSRIWSSTAADQRDAEPTARRAATSPARASSTAAGDQEGEPAVDELHHDRIVDEIGSQGVSIGVPAGNHSSPIFGQLLNA